MSNEFFKKTYRYGKIGLETRRIGKLDGIIGRFCSSTCSPVASRDQRDKQFDQRPVEEQGRRWRPNQGLHPSLQTGIGGMGGDEGLPQDQQFRVVAAVVRERLSNVSDGVQSDRYGLAERDRESDDERIEAGELAQQR